jgi:hypothetical protein
MLQISECRSVHLRKQRKYNAHMQWAVRENWGYIDLIEEKYFIIISEL